MKKTITILLLTIISITSYAQVSSYIKKGDSYLSRENYKSAYFQYAKAIQHFDNVKKKEKAHLIYKYCVSSINMFYASKDEESLSDLSFFNDAIIDAKKWIEKITLYNKNYIPTDEVNKLHDEIYVSIKTLSSVYLEIGSKKKNSRLIESSITLSNLYINYKNDDYFVYNLRGFGNFLLKNYGLAKPDLEKGIKLFNNYNEQDKTLNISTAYSSLAEMSLAARLEDTANFAKAMNYVNEGKETLEEQWNLLNDNEKSEVVDMFMTHNELFDKLEISILLNNPGNIKNAFTKIDSYLTSHRDDYELTVGAAAYYITSDTKKSIMYAERAIVIDSTQAEPFAIIASNYLFKADSIDKEIKQIGNKEFSRLGELRELMKQREQMHEIAFTYFEKAYTKDATDYRLVASLVDMCAVLEYREKYEYYMDVLNKL